MNVQKKEQIKNLVNLVRNESNLWTFTLLLKRKWEKNCLNIQEKEGHEIFNGHIKSILTSL